jgi:hypothetical protein
MTVKNKVKRTWHPSYGVQWWLVVDYGQARLFVADKQFEFPKYTKSRAKHVIASLII